jgi:hypothetical protein
MGYGTLVIGSGLDEIRDLSDSLMLLLTYALAGWQCCDALCQASSFALTFRFIMTHAALQATASRPATGRRQSG